MTCRAGRTYGNIAGAVGGAVLAVGCDRRGAWCPLEPDSPFARHMRRGQAGLAYGAGSHPPDGDGCPVRRALRRCTDPVAVLCQRRSVPAAGSAGAGVRILCMVSHAGKTAGRSDRPAVCLVACRITETVCAACAADRVHGAAARQSVPRGIGANPEAAGHRRM